MLMLMICFTPAQLPSCTHDRADAPDRPLITRVIGRDNYPLSSSAKLCWGALHVWLHGELDLRIASLSLLSHLVLSHRGDVCV